MKIFSITIILLFFSLNLYSKKEISLGAGGLSWGLSFQDNFINDNHSYRITGLAYMYADGDKFYDKFANISAQYNYSVKSTSSENLYVLLGTSFLYSVKYSGSISDSKETIYYKGAIGLGINEIFFETLSLSLEFHQIIHFNNSVSHVDATRVSNDLYTYPSISIYLGIIF